MASTDEAAASERWLSGSVRKDGARDLLSGMISGFFCKILEYPFDTIKVLEQTGGAKFSGPLDAARKTVAESGLLSLYDGLAAPLIGSMAECASLLRGVWSDQERAGRRRGGGRPSTRCRTS